MTATIGRAAEECAAAGTIIEAVTSSTGPVSIEGYYDEALCLPQEHRRHRVAHGWVVNDDEVPALHVGTGRRPAPAVDDPLENVAAHNLAGLELAHAAATAHDLLERGELVPFLHVALHFRQSWVGGLAAANLAADIVPGEYKTFTGMTLSGGSESASSLCQPAQ